MKLVTHRNPVWGVFAVLGNLSRLLWSPSLWKSLYALRPHLASSAKSGITPQVHYSQDAEDVSLVEILQKEGFFVDVGAHHPERFSVTKLLYDQGWRGVNIDITPAMKRDFPKRRKRDVNIEAVVGNQGFVTFFRFEEEALNTSDQARAKMLVSAGERLVEKVSVESVPLTEILVQNCAPARVDLLNVDVEGADLQVLQSMDWNRFNVAAVLVEIGKPAWLLFDDPVSEFLQQKGLVPTLCFPRSVLFLERNHPSNQFFRV